MKKPQTLQDATTMPALASLYAKALREEYGVVHYYAIKRYWNRFAQREAELVKAGIDLREYAAVVAKLWKRWCAERGMKFLPINIFLGPKSEEWFWHVWSQPTVRLDRKAQTAQVLNDEHTLARLYIEEAQNGKVLTVLSLANSIHQQLSPDWWDAHERGERPIPEVLELLNREYHMSCVANNYTDFAIAVQRRSA